MKMNKLAAGALALALGLGAVAPAVAAETKEYTGAQLALERYEKDVKKLNELRKAYLDEAELNEKLTKNLADAKAELKAAKDAYQALFPGYVFVTDKDGKALPLGDLARLQPEKYAAELNQLTTMTVGVDSDLKTYQTAEANKAGSGKAAVEAAIDSYARKGKKADVRDEVFNAAADRYVASIVEYAESIKQGSAKDLAYKKVLAAERKLDVAQQEYDDKYSTKAAGKYEEAFARLETSAKTYGFAIQVGNNGLKLVKDGEAKVESPKKFNIKELKAAREKALQTLEAVKLLEELAPKKIADVKAELNKLVEEQKALIKLADKYLAKEMALVSTAYAAEDEEEMSPEELTKKLNEKSDKIQDLIKDKEEDKKPEKKPEEDKKPEKKPEENKPAKKSGNNARTGIAGVAGVAGILAAASVAYAASKRD